MKLFYVNPCICVPDRSSMTLLHDNFVILPSDLNVHYLLLIFPHVAPDLDQVKLIYIFIKGTEEEVHNNS